jgi:methylmalonyl-CoA mutase N-terminal domain/subunit
MLAAIESGYVQKEIQEAAYVYQKAVESGDAIVVGVNSFQSGIEEPIPILTIDERIEREQIERLRALRQRRNNEAVTAQLDRLEKAAAGTENLLPHILAAVEVYATVGEISNRLRKVWGEYQEAVTI